MRVFGEHFAHGNISRKFGIGSDRMDRDRFFIGVVLRRQFLNHALVLERRERFLQRHLEFVQYTFGRQCFAKLLILLFALFRSGLGVPSAN